VGTRGSSPGVKRLGREADHSPPSSAEIKNAWSYTSIPQLKNRGDNSTFTLILKTSKKQRNSVRNVRYDMKFYNVKHIN
jgi:hypothetical protein